MSHIYKFSRKVTAFFSIIQIYLQYFLALANSSRTTWSLTDKTCIFKNKIVPL